MKKMNAALLLLTASLLAVSAPVPAHAEAATASQVQGAARPMEVYLDDRLLQTEAEPLIIDGSVLVPMRPLFEAHGAKLIWNSAAKTVTATKDSNTLTYRIGELNAVFNGKPVSLMVPGQIVDGSTLMPLRFVSETLGSSVKWNPDTRTVHISSPLSLDTTVRWGVNLRSEPYANSASATGVMLSAGEKVHVIREVDAFWLEVRTQDNKHGYISAKPKYTDYTSPSLVDRQGEALIAYGKQYLGTPYEFGASPDQTNTFDCSSFVKLVFQDVLSIDLPRVSYNQAKEGQEVALDELRTGDLLFFNSRGLDIGHVGIYAGNNQILHTYSKKLGVHIGEFDGQWKERFVTARRIF